MQFNTDRIMTTHVGSLPRPDDLRAALQASERSMDRDPVAFDRLCRTAVQEVVSKQVECGVDFVSDGEMSKISYVGYVKDRLNGIREGLAVTKDAEISAVLPTNVSFPDIAAHPDFAEHRAKQGANLAATPIYADQITYGDEAFLNADIARFKAAATSARANRLFMNAASPGVLAMFIPTTHYRSEDNYIADLADAMRREYEAIHRAGFILQIDCPDLAMNWHMRYWRSTEKEFLRAAHRNLDAVNHATSNIPPEAMRLHLCWGNYHGPHTHDFPIAKLFAVINKARPQSILFEGANPRHDHEWEDWQNANLPDDRVLIPGVIDSTINFVEHPRLVAQRIIRYTNAVGKERVIAGTDCGFGTFALRAHQVFPSIVWSKLKALAEGAEIASKFLWRR